MSSIVEPLLSAQQKSVRVCLMVIDAQMRSSLSFACAVRYFVVLPCDERHCVCPKNFPGF